jgi:mRNA-degrading endonuclease RelE of RelBE toxin-antitoxin system
MSYSIISTHRFEKELKRLAKKFSSLKNKYAELITENIENLKSTNPQLHFPQTSKKNCDASITLHRSLSCSI